MAHFCKNPLTAFPAKDIFRKISALGISSPDPRCLLRDIGKGPLTLMTQRTHRIRLFLSCIGLGLLLLVPLGSGYAQAPSAEEQGTKQQAASEQEAPQEQPAAQGQEVPQQAATHGVPGPIRFELTPRVELKYEQILYETSGHVHRFLLSGSYVFSNISIGVDEFPIIKVDTTGHPDEGYMLGDIILRFGYVPYVAPSGNFGVALVTNLTCPTGDFEKGASNGRFAPEPRLFLPYKVNQWFTIVPAFYYMFTLKKEEELAQKVNLLTLRLINIFYPSSTTYLIVEPRYYYDFEGNSPSGELRFHIGTMITRNTTAFVEYSAGLGVNKLFEAKAACGLRYFFR